LLIVIWWVVAVLVELFGSFGGLAAVSRTSAVVDLFDGSWFSSILDTTTMTTPIATMEVLPGVSIADLDYLIASMDGSDQTDVITLLNEWMLKDEEVNTKKMVK
jgi:hypothetical protein